MRGPKVFYLFAVVVTLFVIAGMRNPRLAIAQQSKKHQVTMVEYVSLNIRGKTSENIGAIRDAVDKFKQDRPDFLMELVVTGVAPQVTCNQQVPQVGCHTDGILITYVVSSVQK